MIHLDAHLLGIMATKHAAISAHGKRISFVQDLALS